MEAKEAMEAMEAKEAMEAMEARQASEAREASEVREARVAREARVMLCRLFGQLLGHPYTRCKGGNVILPNTLNSAKKLLL